LSSADDSTHRYSSRWNDHVVNVSVNYFPSSSLLNMQQTVLWHLYASSHKATGTRKSVFLCERNIPRSLDRGLVNAVFYFQGNRSKNRSALHTKIGEKKGGWCRLLLFSFCFVLLCFICSLYFIRKNWCISATKDKA